MKDILSSGLVPTSDDVADLVGLVDLHKSPIGSIFPYDEDHITQNCSVHNVDLDNMEGSIVPSSFHSNSLAPKP